MARKHINSQVKIKDGYRVVIYYENVTYKTGITLNTEKADFKKQFDKKNGCLTAAWGPDYLKANQIIFDKKNFIDSLIVEANHKNINATQYIKAYSSKKSVEVKEGIVVNNTLISDFLGEYITYKEEVSKHKKEKSEFEMLKNVKKKVAEFEDETGTKKTINEVNLAWRNRLCEFLTKKRTRKITVNNSKNKFEQNKKKGLSNSSLNSYMWRLTGFFQWVEYTYKITVDKDLLSFHPYDTATPEDAILTPTLEQWTEFKNYVPTSKGLQKTYDLAMFSAYTGMRFSDCKTLYNVHILSEVDGVVTIKKRAIKTGAWFEVTLNPMALAIFNKYNRDFRNKFVSNTQTNTNLTTIFMTLPSWRVKVKYIEYVLEKEIEVEDWMYNVATFHIFRKIFTTFLFAQGTYSTNEIMQFTGWKSDKMMRVYSNVFNDYNKKEKQIPMF